jgi:hypothetical protein
MPSVPCPEAVFATEVEGSLVVRLASEDSGSGFDRIVSEEMVLCWGELVEGTEVDRGGRASAVPSDVEATEVVVTVSERCGRIFNSGVMGWTGRKRGRVSQALIEFIFRATTYPVDGRGTGPNISHGDADLKRLSTRKTAI